jgi:2-polyprenyl-6-methoxyphenol hydroxylase-like FAD-dependent oxidoreductase
MISSVRIVRIEKSTDGLFFLYSSSSTYGPYRTVVGADGIFSIIRSHAYNGTYLIGDARWVQDVSWYDLGTTRIAKGANMAMMDGLELGMILVDNFQCKNGGDMSMTTHVYCARKIRAASNSMVFLHVCVDCNDCCN